jgi:hypothetical protein
VISTDINARAEADGALGRFKSTRQLLRLSVGDAITAEELPVGGDFAEPVLHLGNNETAKLHVGEGLGAEDTDRNQMLAVGRIGRGHLRDDGQVVDGTGAIAVEDENGKRHGRFFGGIVEASDAARGGLDFSNKVSGGRAVCGNDDGAGAKGFTAGKGQLVFVQRIDARIEANGAGRKLCGKLHGDVAHTTRRNASAALGNHFEDELEHAGRGVEPSFEKNAADERAEEVMNHFPGEAFGEQGILGGAVGAAEDLLDGGVEETTTEARDAKFVAKGTKIGLESFPPSTGSAPGIDEFVHSAGIPGERAMSERLEIEERIIQDALGFGIGSEEHLETTIKQKTVELVGTNAAANDVRSFEDLKADALFVKKARAGEAGQACTNDKNIRAGRHSSVHLRGVKPEAQNANAEVISCCKRSEKRKGWRDGSVAAGADAP